MNIKRLTVALAAVALQACSRAAVASQSPATGSTTRSTAQMSAPNTLTPAEIRDGWKLLFDGKAIDAWRGYKAPAMTGPWQVVDGAMVKTRGARDGDIVTREQFGDFDLTLEWKISVEGNAGIFYRATEEYDKVYWSGPEYQLLDNVKGADNKTPLTRAGAVYGFYPAPDGHDKLAVWVAPVDSVTRRARAVTPADISEFLKMGEWNKTRILVKGNHVEHWLNDFKLAEYELGSAEWLAKLKGSKFEPYPNFSKAKVGLIGIQGDHGGLLALRNIKIRPLK